VQIGSLAAGIRSLLVTEELAATQAGYVGYRGIGSTLGDARVEKLTGQASI
jgi:hypothetical protein